MDKFLRGKRSRDGNARYSIISLRAIKMNYVSKQVQSL
jgi:hypothetical protein